MKKIISILTFSLLLLVAFNLNGTKAQAETLLNPDIEFNNEIIDENGNVLTFPSKDDYDNYLRAQRASIQKPGEITTQVIMFNRKRTLVSKERKNMLFVGYSKATPDWMYAPYYDISRGTKHDISGSYKYSGSTVNIGFSKTFNVGTRLTASERKLNKLGGYADITFEKTRVDLYESGQKLSTYYETKKTTHNTYLKVKFK